MGLISAFLGAQLLRVQATVAANGIWLAVHAAPWLILAALAVYDWQTGIGGKVRLILAAVAVVAVYLQLTGHFPSFKGF